MGTQQQKLKSVVVFPFSSNGSTWKRNLRILKS